MSLVMMKKKGGVLSLAAFSIMVAILILISSASSAHGRRRLRCYRIRDGVKVFRSCESQYEIYHVDLRKPPNADAMDDDAWGRWYESFLPSSGTVVDDAHRRWHKYFRPDDDEVDEDEPRYFNCFSYPGEDYGHIVVGLTGSDEAEEIANKPGVVRVYNTMGQPWIVPVNTPCSRNVSSFNENSLQEEFETVPDASPSG